MLEAYQDDHKACMSTLYREKKDHSQHMRSLRYEEFRRESNRRVSVQQRIRDSINQGRRQVNEFYRMKSKEAADQYAKTIEATAQEQAADLARARELEARERMLLEELQHSRLQLNQVKEQVKITQKISDQEFLGRLENESEGKGKSARNSQVQMLLTQAKSMHFLSQDNPEQQTI
jgi:hypothetical protein